MCGGECSQKLRAAQEETATWQSRIADLEFQVQEANASREVLQTRVLGVEQQVVHRNETIQQQQQTLAHLGTCFHNAGGCACVSAGG